MATVFTANSSGIQVDGKAVDGVRGIQYQLVRDQSEVFALGSHERISVYYGPSRVLGRIQVASASPALDALTSGGASFQVVANLKHGQGARSVAFDECHMERKEFSLGTGEHAETTYVFTATRVREDDKAGGEGGAAGGGG